MVSHQPGRAAAKTISVEEAGRWLGISRNSAYEAVKRGEIPTIKIGRLLLVPVAPFERMLGLSVNTSAEAA
ncbi:DNA-binding protein [Methylobacterium sp. P1-11]|uniref:helix-turn-helix domain-containing protein n=1 Tax=Methylobacterium sp. P1-11 TaxID=2024616 RepID=UPI0011EF3423|nr:helix-turn-helix domain-containing protein [Methylobacterium sp. P1-11]KAA0122228.1 DNA-binding protein [Methylobacterium sp. P1-11]